MTKIVREVRLLPAGEKAKPASVNDQVDANTGVRTGDRSRSELTFVDLTIERLGSNTVFHFNKGGRVVQLDSGSLLLRVPKDSGGAQMQSRAVTVGISGTTVILETTSAGRNKLIVLEGSARLALKRNPRESVSVRGGQMEDVPAGATKLPPPVNINLADVMQHHPLITGFDTLPSKDLIDQTIQDEPVQGQRVSGGGPSIFPPVIGGIIGGTTVGGNPGRSGGGKQGRQPPNRNGQTGTGDGVGSSNPTKGGGTGAATNGRRSPTPPPKRKPNTG